MSPLQTVLDALTNDGTHEDGCPDSNYCFNTECDYCQPIHAMRELNAIAVVKRMMQAEPVIEVVRMPDHWKDRFFYADSRSYISESSISKLPIGTKLYTHPAPQPVPPHECKTYEEKLAYAAGWWKALEANSAQPSTDDNLRLKFESEYRRLYPVLCDIRPNKFERDGEDSYAETIVNVAWNLFKAAQPVREPLTAQVLHDFSPIFGGDK
jgi:hypothetical protein